ncbi:hypothetical protein [Lampropedia aestuarii]|uniref:hypothetical protein n=1 Tax=Lampropedia aestuarii TaxID=2562762 RepID=UPI002468E722|nr:hypothetical protein [Lampropedia aestuarii]MDH5857494.1 hypothetical protein [Lampropedia aestuarii]
MAAKANTTEPNLKVFFIELAPIIKSTILQNISRPSVRNNHQLLLTIAFNAYHQRYWLGALQTVLPQRNIPTTGHLRGLFTISMQSRKAQGWSPKGTLLC